MAIEEVLEEISADRDSELSDEESEDFSEYNGDSSSSEEIDDSGEKVERFKEHCSKNYPI